MKPSLLLLLTALFVTSISAQTRKDFVRSIQFSLTPGISSNGLHPGGYVNKISFNLTSGYSAANKVLEVGVISNLNVMDTRGLQFAGIANVTGGNAYEKLLPKEIDKLKREGFEANLTGAQFSGLANVVLNNVFGGQITGGVNVSRGALLGLQIAGISNTVHKYAFGVQLAGLYNVSTQSMDGAQISALFNFTNGGLYGFQLGAFNRAKATEGINSFEIDDPSGVQIGIVNSAGRMNGFQIGIINHAIRSQGTQIGLINIYKNGKTPETRDGTAIGLLNLGSSGYLSVYTTDLFLTNLEIATGTVKNRRKMGDRREMQIQNALIYSNDPGFVNSEIWAVGYGIKKMFFNRSLTPGRSRFNFFSFGTDLLHINKERKKWTKELNLISRPTAAFGSRIHPKNRNFFFFGSVACNVYVAQSDAGLESLTGSIKKNGSVWPGFSAGVLIQ